jgi:ABC-type uncharacterized transport system involved in gliding motility auxiliary subunit
MQPEQPYLGTPADHGLGDLLGHYGFEVGANVILDGQNSVTGVIPLGQEAQPTRMFFPLAETLEKDHNQMFEGLEFIALPFISTVKATKPQGAEVKPILRTVETSLRQDNALAVTRTLSIDPKSAPHGPFEVAFSFSGKLTSFYAGKPRPEGVSAPEAPKPEEGGELMSAPPATDSLAESPPGTRLIVVGGSEFAEDKMFRIMQMVRSNVFVNGFRGVHNMVDWLAQDTDLVSVRGKVVARPLEGIEPGKKAWVKAGNVVGAPLALIAFGLVYWRLRERRRRTVKL